MEITVFAMHSVQGDKICRILDNNRRKPPICSWNDILLGHHQVLTCLFMVRTLFIAETIKPISYYDVLKLTSLDSVVVNRSLMVGIADCVTRAEKEAITGPNMVFFASGFDKNLMK